MKISAASRTIGTALIGVALFAIVALMIWSGGLEGMTTGKPTFAATMGANLLVGLAAAAAGAVFGFIFGMPRTMTLTERVAFAKAVKEEGLSDKTQAVMGVNTNLERVSDWLTTLLVGATLVQIKPIADWIGELGSKLFKEGSTTPNDAIVPVIIILFFCLSFLGIYLITRLYLTSALSLTGGTVTTRDADSQQELSDRIGKAVESGRTDDIVAALKALDDAELPDDVRKSPALNTNVARALSKLISSGTASGRVDPKAELRTAIDNAVANPQVAEELKTEAGRKSLQTGDAGLDKEIGAKLSASGASAVAQKSTLTTLNERIETALNSGKVEDLTAAFGAIGETMLSSEEKENVALNARIVRLVAKILQLNTASDRIKAVNILRDAAQRAATEPAVAKGLREGFDEGSLTTGDTALDDDLKNRLEPR